MPSLGPAPKWCTFLEQLTEELEESKSTTLYEDYKFLTALDLEKLNSTHLIGTPSLKAYMHGYFMELKQYQKLLQATNPFAFEQYKKSQIEKKLKEKAEKRINFSEQKAKVNIDYVKELEQRAKQNKKQQEAAANVLGDDRFKPLFEDKDFAIDRQSEHYKLLKPTEKQKKIVESDDEALEAAPVQVNKGKDFNKLFAGQDDDEESAAEEETNNFEKKISKDEKKK